MSSRRPSTDPAIGATALHPVGIRTICAVLTVHNRRALTTQLLSALRRANENVSDVELAVVLTDDGSSDETAAAARAAFPGVEILQGDGSLFYAGGMALAQDRAMQRQPDFILWLNDDVILDDDAIRRALDASASTDIVVGAVRSRSGQTTYSGMRQVKGLYGRLVGAFAEVEPTGSYERIDTFQGNFVLLSQRAYKMVGSIDAQFAHGFSDIDYGLRARAVGLRLTLLGRTVGVCESNPVEQTWEDGRLSLRARIRLLFGRKAFPAASQWRFATRHGGARAPLWFSSTYVSAFKRMLRP